jgi:hypothetical protein
MKDANDDAKSDPKEFRRVARELRETLSPKGGRTLRGSAFHASPADEESDATDTAAGSKKATPPKGRSGRKRLRAQSLESKDSKKATLECPACGMRGNGLTDCWCIFVEQKPKDLTVPASRVRKHKRLLKTTQS